MHTYLLAFRGNGWFATRCMVDIFGGFGKKGRLVDGVAPGDSIEDDGVCGKCRAILRFRIWD